METSAPKRRRTSPRTSIPIQPGASQEEQNQQTQAESTTPPDPPPSNRAKRPSFASPTKSSLARHNPEILQRKRPTSRGGGGSQPGAWRPTSRHSDVDAAMANAQLAEQSNANAAGPSSTAGYDPQSAPADPSRRSPTRRIGGALADRPKRTPTRPKPRPLPPPGPEEEEDLFNPFAGRALRRSGLGVLPAETQAEPELPPTPEHPDPEITTPPSGIHNTPSKRPRRSKALNVPKSSPLKQPPSKLRNAMGRASPAKDVPKQPQPLRRRSARLNGMKAPKPHPGRRVPPAGPDAAKERLRDALLAEVAELEADLALASQENERINGLRLSRAELSAPANREEILAVLRRHVLSKKEQQTQPPASTEWLRAALNPIAFLPFSKPSTSLPTLFPAGKEKTDEKDPISHHPIPMTAEEELPYLQAFTPLSFTSHLSMLPASADTPDAPGLQRHSIFITSTSPPGVFAARIDMTVNTKTHTITDLAVPKLDPAAMAEVNPLIERILSKDSPQSGLTRNVSILTWAMGEWFRIALRRARFWALLHKELGDKDAFAETVTRLRSRPKRKRRRKGDDADAADEDSQPGAAAEVSTEDILPHLGRISMDLDLPNDEACAVRVQWRVEFDWSGEAQSKVGVLLGVPGKWHKADDRGRLGRIPKIFSDLVHDETDPIDAVKTVAALLAGDVPA